MPYYITKDSAECSGWAVTKDNGDVIGCHQTKQDAIDQMVAVSISEGIDPGGEKKSADIDAEIEDIDPSDMRFIAPRDNIVRKVEFRAEPSADGLTLEGYAAVFNQWTDIDSYEGTFRERISPGAFKRSIDHNRMPVLQFDHGTHPLIGSIPLGVITSLREDSHGLKVQARLADNWLVEPVRDAIRGGAIQGMSFRFKVINDKWAKGKDMPERTITETKLYEVGPVVFPAYEQTSVGVRTRDVLTSLSDPDVRGEIAKMLTYGTSTEHAMTTPTDSPLHSVRTKNQRRALALLALKDQNK